MIEEVDIGYLIPRVMRVYSMPYRDVMGLPLKVFWHLSGSVPRLLADENRDQFELLAHSHSSESALAMREHLESAAPAPIKLTGKAMVERTSHRDEAGFDDLRAMAS